MNLDTVIGKHLKEKHRQEPTNLRECFKILKKCRGKFECLIYEMLLIKEKRLTLNTQPTPFQKNLHFILPFFFSSNFMLCFTPSFPIWFHSIFYLHLIMVTLPKRHVLIALLFILKWTWTQSLKNSTRGCFSPQSSTASYPFWVSIATTKCFTPQELWPNLLMRQV